MPIVSTADNQIFLHELQEPFERLEFQFVPEELAWQRTGSWVNVPIVGRNNSRKHLTGGEDTLSFALDFTGYFEKDKQMCARKFAWLRSLTFTDGSIGPPRNVKLVWGQTTLFRHQIWVVRSVNARFSDFHSRFGMNPMQVIIDVTLELDPTENDRLRDVRIWDVDDFNPFQSINDFISPPSNGIIA